MKRNSLPKSIREYCPEDIDDSDIGAWLLGFLSGRYVGQGGDVRSSLNGCIEYPTKPLYVDKTTYSLIYDPV